MRINTPRRAYLGQILGTKLLMIISVGFWLCLAACATDFPQSDCGAIRNVRIRGIVVDSQGSPLPNTEMLIQSRKMNKCSVSTPIADISLINDEDGLFDATIPIIFEDDILSIKFEAQGYIPYILDYTTYVTFANELKITLYSSIITTNTP
jgi:hypothetical protein